MSLTVTSGKFRAISAAGLGIDGRGSGRTVAGAQNIAADDAVAAVAEEALVFEQFRPPGGHSAEPESAWQTKTTLSPAAFGSPYMA